MLVRALIMCVFQTVSVCTKMIGYLSCTPFFKLVTLTNISASVELNQSFEKCVSHLVVYIPK